MSTIIKASGARSGRSSAGGVAFNFSDMSEQADDYLQRVRGEAAEIIAAAETEAAQIRQRAQEQGREVAMQAAVKTLRGEVEGQLKTLLPAVGKVADDLHHARDAWVRQWDQNALRLATAIAEKVIRREIRQTPEIQLDLIREALELASGDGQIQLRLHPGDYEMLKDQVELLTAELGKLGSSQIIADPEVSPGGCRIDTEFGSIDQQLSAILARIQEELS